LAIEKFSSVYMPCESEGFCYLFGCLGWVGAQKENESERAPPREPQPAARRCEVQRVLGPTRALGGTPSV
jgi:hypothetical protein